MVSSKLFMNNTTQAVRFPKEVAFSSDVSEVEILIAGDARVVVPKRHALRWVLEHGPGVTDDFDVTSEVPQPADPDIAWPS